uniref:Titin n=1 Tax=Oryzias sinensis TaxID=183150 RepID=A0A8C7YLC2_9TELE
MSLKVESLPEGGIFFFRVLAENEYGVGLQAKTIEPIKISEKPQPPGKVSVVDVSRSTVSLKWEKPIHDGGSRVSHYEVEMAPKDSDTWSLCASVKSLETTVASLLQGEEYQFRVVAVNDKGKSDPRQLSHSVVAKDLTIEPSIRPKASTYSVQVGYDLKIEVPIAGHPKPTITWTKDEDSKYDFRVIARNAAGAVSKPSDTTGSIMAKDEVETPKCETDPIYNQTIVINAGETFTLEASVEGKPIPTAQWFKGSFEVENTARAEIKNTDCKAILVVKDAIRVDGGQYTLVLTNVAGTKTVPFSVKVLDRPGPSEGPLTISNVTEEKCSLSWLPPRHDGGASISHYVIQKRETSRLTTRLNVLSTSSSTKLVIKDANKEDSGKYSVTATSSIGTVTEEIIVIILDKPGPPTGPVKIEEVSCNYVVLSWEPPEYTGGCQINNYIVEKRDTTTTNWQIVSATIARTTIKVSKLKTGVEYQFRVCAENRYGKSSPIVSPAVIAQYPFSVPAAPGTPITTAATKDNMVVEWKPPSNNGGSPILGYHLERKEKNKPRFKTTDLEEGIEYEFRVYAENIAGVSPASKVSDGTVARDPCDPPGTPEAIEITRNHVTLQWTKPQYDGGSLITGYLIERKKYPDTRWMKKPVYDLRVKASHLREGCEYEYRVFAENAAGLSKPSTPCPLTKAEDPQFLPSPPAKPKIIDSTKNTVTLSWNKPLFDVTMNFFLLL